MFHTCWFASCDKPAPRHAIFSPQFLCKAFFPIFFKFSPKDFLFEAQSNRLGQRLVPRVHLIQAMNFIFLLSSASKYPSPTRNRLFSFFCLPFFFPPSPPEFRPYGARFVGAVAPKLSVLARSRYLISDFCFGGTGPVSQDLNVILPFAVFLPLLFPRGKVSEYTFFSNQAIGTAIFTPSFSLTLRKSLRQSFLR